MTADTSSDELGDGEEFQQQAWEYVGRDASVSMLHHHRREIEDYAYEIADAIRYDDLDADDVNALRGEILYFLSFVEDNLIPLADEAPSCGGETPGGDGGE